jgi:hypothetical protein
MNQIARGDNPESYFADSPATYRVRVKGRASSDWIDAMWAGVLVKYGSDPTSGVATTDLIAQVRDQAAFMGLINAFYNNGYALLEVERFYPTAEVARAAEADDVGEN